MATLFRFALLTIVALYLGVSTLGIGISMNMAAPNCVMMEHRTQMCPMSVADHLSAWGSMFQGLPSKAVVLLAVLILVFTLIQSYQLLGTALRYTRHYRNGRDGPDPQRNITLQLISRGILQPTVYG